MTALRIIFLGTAELSCASLQALADDPQFQIAAVVTQPDRPKGRELKPQPSPVKSLALRLGLPVFQPERVRNEKFIAELGELKPDLIVVVAYGQILPPVILDLPRHGCLNVHTSLLPKYRGAAPIQWAIANGDTETGVTIMKMDVGLDTGEIVATRRTPILPEDNSATLHDRLAQLGAELLAQTIPEYVAGKIKPVPQPAAGASSRQKSKRRTVALIGTGPRGKFGTGCAPSRPGPARSRSCPSNRWWGERLPGRSLPAKSGPREPGWQQQNHSF